MMRLLRPSHISIFLRSFGSHSTHYAREMIAEICSMGAIALRSPCSAQARGGLPWPRDACVAPSLRRSLLGQAPRVAHAAPSRRGRIGTKSASDMPFRADPRTALQVRAMCPQRDVADQAVESLCQRNTYSNSREV